MRQFICQIDHLRHHFLDLFHDLLQQFLLLRVGDKPFSRHILYGVENYRQLLRRKEKCRREQTGMSGKILLRGCVVVLIIISLPQSGSVWDTLPRDEFHAIAALALMPRQHHIAELRQHTVVPRQAIRRQKVVLRTGLKACTMQPVSYLCQVFFL